MNVVLERLASQEATSLDAERERRLPRRQLQRRGPSLLEGENVIRTLHDGDVRQKAANRVTGSILQMIQFRDAQSLDGGQCGSARVEEDAH
jgi:hypothetical protein